MTSQRTIPAQTSFVSRLWQSLKGLRPSYVPIAYKLAFVLTILISTGMISLGLTIVTNQTRLLRNQINSFGQASASQLGESAKELILSDDLLGLMVVIRNFGNKGNILGAAVYSEKGERLTASGAIPDQDISKLFADSTLIGENTYSYEWNEEGESGIDAISFFSPILFNDVLTGYALVTFGKETMGQALRDTVRTITISTVIMILVSVVIAFVTGKRLSRPINELMDASVAIGKGDYRHQIQERRNDEIGFLTEAFNKMATDLLEKEQVENAFSRFVSNSVAKQILSNLNHIQLGGKHVEGTVLFADIVGFTSFSEKMPASEVADLLNEYFTYISAVSSLYQGTIDKYMGDCAMVIFGIPDADPDHKFHALICAVMIQKLVVRLNKKRIEQGKPSIHFRIGVNSGTMLAGNMGSVDRMQYTVVGDTVNLASRLHTVAAKDQIVITDLLYHDEKLKSRIVAEKFKSLKLRGISEEVSTYLVLDVAESWQLEINRQIDGLIQQIQSS